jgi:hypothetical protein
MVVQFLMLTFFHLSPGLPCPCHRRVNGFQVPAFSLAAIHFGVKGVKGVSRSNGASQRSFIGSRLRRKGKIGGLPSR